MVLVFRSVLLRSNVCDSIVLSKDPKVPICLLEVNLSCNFFRGKFDEQVRGDVASDFENKVYSSTTTTFSPRQVYFDFVDGLFQKIQDLRIQSETKK
jgi:hypothetical protein